MMDFAWKLLENRGKIKKLVLLDFINIAENNPATLPEKVVPVEINQNLLF